MNNREKLAVLTALEKLVKDRKAEVRAECDAEFADLCSEFGTDKITLTVNGSKVGSYTMTFRPEGFTVTDREAFEDFCLTYGLATVKRSIRPTMMHAAIKVIEGSIEPDHWRDFIEEEVVVVGDWEEKLVNVAGKVLYADSGLEVPGVVFRPRTMKNTQVKGCKPEDVEPLIKAMPGGINALLLGGGE